MLSGFVGLVRVIEFRDLAVVDDCVQVMAAGSAVRVVFGIEEHMVGVFVGDVLVVVHVDVVAVVGPHVYDFRGLDLVQQGFPRLFVFSSYMLDISRVGASHLN